MDSTEHSFPNKPAKAPGISLSTKTAWEPKAFQPIVEQFHAALYRYFAVHTGGDLQKAQEITVETLASIYCKPGWTTKQSFSSWLFGVAWDVLNAHSSRMDGETARDFVIPAHASQVLTMLRSLSFYPREIVYLRFFADLDLKDIATLMDKNQGRIKVLVYQGVMEFAARLTGSNPVELSREQLVHAAQAYHVYFNHLRAGTVVPHEIPLPADQATRELTMLRNVLSMTGDTHSYLLARMDELYRSETPSATQL